MTKRKIGFWRWLWSGFKFICIILAMIPRAVLSEPGVAIWGGLMGTFLFAIFPVKVNGVIFPYSRLLAIPCILITLHGVYRDSMEDC